MLKRLLFFLFIMVCIISVSNVTSFAADFTDSQGIQYGYESSYDYYKVSGYVGSSTEITIPSTINGKPVMSIGGGHLNKIIF